MLSRKRRETRSAIALRKIFVSARPPNLTTLKRHPKGRCSLRLMSLPFPSRAKFSMSGESVPAATDMRFHHVDVAEEEGSLLRRKDGVCTTVKEAAHQSLRRRRRCSAPKTAGKGAIDSFEHRKKASTDGALHGPLFCPPAGCRSLQVSWVLSALGAAGGVVGTRLLLLATGVVWEDGVHTCCRSA